MFEITTNRRRRRPSQESTSSSTSRQSKSTRSTTLLLIFGLASLLFYDDLLSLDTSFYDYIEGVDYEESVSDSYDGETEEVEVDNINRRLRVLDKEKQAKKRADVVATRTVVNKKGQVVERPVISALDFFSRAVAPKNDGTNVKEDLTNEQVEQEKLGQSIASSFEAWDNTKEAVAAPKVQEIPKDLIPVDIDIDQYGDEENTIHHPKAELKKAASKAVDSATRYQDQESSSATAGFNPAVYELEDTAAVSNVPPLSVCERLAPLSHDKDLQILSKYKSQCTANKSKTPQDTSLLLLEGVKTYGRTGNNLIEFLHAMQYAKDYGHTVAIKHGSWPIQRLITDMWMSVQDDVRSRHSQERQEKMKEWYSFFEEQFCVKMIDPDKDDLSIYKDVIRMDTKDLFMFQHDNSISNFDEYVEYQGYLIRTLFRHYNKGYGVNLRNQPVKDMCSVLDTMFVNQDVNNLKYSVIHSRSLEGEPGKFLLGRIAEFSGCDDQAALDMTPDYVKSILQETDMLSHPIIFITDGQRPKILDRLLADEILGPNIHLIPEETSWVGGDITIAITSTVFIGNPASTFSGFIAKSRVALGFDKSYLFRKMDEDTGKWTDVCGRNCIYNKSIMHSMA